MKIQLADYQKEAIRGGRDLGTLLLLWRRQAGKTTTFSWQALRWMLEHAGCLVTFSTCSLALGAEMTEREAALLSSIISAIRDAAGSDRVKSTADGLDWFDVADLYQHNRLEVSLWHDHTTRSRTKIIAASYATARGYSGYVLLDEIGFIRDFKSFYEAIEPVFSRNPEYRLWMATTPPEDDAHYSYELCAYPPGTIFTPSSTGSWYQNDSGLRVHRVSAIDTDLAGVHLYDSRTRQPISPEEHRKKALDKAAWDRNYGLVFTQGGVSAIPLLALEQAQALGAQMGCLFAEDELPPRWFDHIDPQYETAIGIDPATTEKEKSNPTGLCVTQIVDGRYVARFVFRYRTADPKKSRSIIREVCTRVKPRTVAIDATSERYWAAETKAELEGLTDVLLVVSSEQIEHNGESMTLKTYLGNIGVAAIDDRSAALPPDKSLRDDFRLVRRFRGGFDNQQDNAGHHGDTFDGFKLSVYALLQPPGLCEAEAVQVGQSINVGQSKRMSFTKPNFDDSFDSSYFIG